MRFLHTSDWHLGISMHNISMLEEQRNFLNGMRKIITENRIDALIVAGDVFDSSVSNSDAISIYNDIATEVCLSMNIPMFVIAGNHDGAARLASMRELLKGSGMYVSGKLTRDIKPISVGDTDVYLIPFFNIDEVRHLFSDLSVKDYDSAMKTVCDNIRENMNPDKKNLIVSHCFTSGAQLSESERSAIVGTVNIVSKDVFDGFSYVALGHIHRKQKITQNIYYSGSPLKYSVNEANQTKYMLIYDSETDAVEEIAVNPLHDVKIIKGNYEEILNLLSCNDYVKVVLDDKYIGIELLDMLRSIFPNLVSLEGKSVYSDEGTNTLSMSQIKNMSPAEIIEKFLEENFDSEFEENQLRQFLDILENYETEDLS